MGDGQDAARPGERLRAQQLGMENEGELLAWFGCRHGPSKTPHLQSNASWAVERSPARTSPTLRAAENGCCQCTRSPLVRHLSVVCARWDGKLGGRPDREFGLGLVMCFRCVRLVGAG